MHSYTLYSLLLIVLSTDPMEGLQVRVGYDLN